MGISIPTAALVYSRRKIQVREEISKEKVKKKG